MREVWHFLVPDRRRLGVTPLAMRTLAGFVLIAVTIGLFGCPNPNTYASARTLPADDVQVVVAAETYVLIDDGFAGGSAEITPSLPTLGLRYGASDSVDVGVRAVNMASAAADTKVQLMRGRLDLALDPGVQWYRGEGRIEPEGQDISINIFDVHMPILVGWNINKRASLVVSPGVSFRTAIVDGVEHEWFGIAGVGLNLRVTKSFALHPQITAAWALDDAEGTIIGGLGFTFGGQPGFDDLDAPVKESANIVARD
jgi:hypothetical protein